MFGQPSQQTTGFGGFGSTTGATGTGGGHQRSNTSLFAPAASNQPSTGLFGASTSTAPTTSTAPSATSSFGGFGTNATGNTTNPTTGFSFGNTGNTTTTTTSTAPTTGGLFGNTTSTTGTKPSFGGFGTTTNTSGQTGGLKFGTNTTQQPSGGLFGSTTGQQQQQQTLSLFGGAQQQQQQQSDSLLSLRTSFPDTNVPHFIVKPDKVTRTSIPPSLFNKDDQTTTTKIQQDISTATTTRSTSAKAFGAPRTTLPGFLTSATAPVNATKPGQKRVFEGQNESDGVFGMSGDEGFGDSSNRSTKEIDEPPVVSIWDIGVNPRKYSTSPDTTKTSNKPDAWTLAVMHHPQNNTNKLSMNQDNNNNSFLSATMNTVTSCTISHSNSASSNTNKGSTMVKVFGYPAEMKVTVIEFFSKCGQIEERYQSGSNWMTFRYSSSDAAKEALGYHGTLMTKECMIGVIEAKSMTG
ncbi:hypothetical protein INT45_014013 [Circinella minor]|uniref:RRM Nup35-type domain-containing protein n=1 Tax=Circinella minor TaxID=1195481 RepID=A0A8H7S268_9FUNG|nr:hypothetical protein INT45_014013 [Circinella minor]